MNVTIGDVMSFLNSLIPITLGVAAIMYGIRRWIKTITATQEAAAKQLQTSNGTTVAGYVERSSKKLDELAAEVSKQQRVGVQNHEIALSAQALANSAHRRIDEHMIHDHGVQPCVSDDHDGKEQ